jgi:hypothetical protein
MSIVFRSRGIYVEHAEGEEGFRRSNYSYFGTKPRIQRLSSFPLQKENRMTVFTPTPHDYEKIRTFKQMQVSASTSEEKAGEIYCTQVCRGAWVHMLLQCETVYVCQRVLRTQLFTQKYYCILLIQY